MDFLTKKRDKAELLTEKHAILQQATGTIHSYESPRLLEIDAALIDRHGFEWSRAGDGRRRAVTEGSECRWMKQPRQLKQLLRPQ